MREALARAIRRLPCTVSPELVASTRALFAPLHDLPPYGGMRVERDVAYGPHERNRLDLFVPDETAASSAARAIVVFVHGGGFVGGDKSAPNSPYYDNIAVWAAREGFVGVTVTYRLAPAHPYPSAAEDVASALRWIERHCAGFRGDAGAIVPFGQSAGATHIASCIAAGHAKNVAGAVLLSGVYDFEAMRESPNVQAYVGDDRAAMRAASPLTGLASADVPLLFGVSEFDPPEFQAQAAVLFERRWSARGRFPDVIYLPQHNHLSQVAHLGARDTGDSMLADRLSMFVRTAAIS